MANYDYDIWNTGIWVFNANKYTKEDAKALWIIGIDENDIFTNEEIQIVSNAQPPEPEKYYARYFPVPPDSVDGSDFDGGCYALTTTAAARKKKLGEFEVWVIESHGDFLDRILGDDNNVNSI